VRDIIAPHPDQHVAPAPPAPPTPAKPVRILILEDDPAHVEAVYKFSVMWDGLGGEEKAWMFGEMRSVWPVNEDRFYPGLVERWRREVKDLDKLKEILRLDPEVWTRASRFFPK
jgi:hypothetical protein